MSYRIRSRSLTPSCRALFVALLAALGLSFQSVVSDQPFHFAEDFDALDSQDLLGVIARDLDGDGDIDLVRNAPFEKVTWLEGRTGGRGRRE